MEPRFPEGTMRDELSASQFESTHARNVRVAFVEAARFLGGQLFVSFINEIDLLPKICANLEQN
jgi:hypothetical protein